LRETGRPHLLQSSAWATLKAESGWSVRRFVFDADGRRAGVAQVLLKRLPLGVTLAYAPRGPVTDPSEVPDAMRALAAALRGTRCASLLCDPEATDTPELRAALRDAGVRPAGVFVQPRRTLIVDLRHSADELQSAMRRKTRQYIHKAERAGVVTEDTRDVDRFRAILSRVAERDRFAIHDRAYFVRLLELFGDAAHLSLARVGADDVGALLVVRIGDRAWELYGGWSGEHPEERPFYLLKWRSLMRMQQYGVVRYDMWGLSEREGDELAGVENFKLGFGGEVATWVGGLDLPVDRPLYPLWRIAGRRRLAAAAR
jgi:lipid II:glycine glycyltransferase (peptidoglycan interpeptide bridge formation enzyme)